jgi:DNA-binding NarL/FixJ family response regulator
MTDVQLGPVTGEKLSGVRQTDRPTIAGWVLRRYRNRPDAGRRLRALTFRELHLLRLIGRGLSNAEIA